MIELVVMDMAGTTVEDPDGVGGCLKAALTERGAGWEHEAVNAVMGIPKPLAIRELLMQFTTAGAEPDPALIEQIFRSFQQRMIDYYKTSPDVREISGASVVFRALRAAGVKVALDTGFDRAIVNVLLHRLGWDSGLIDATATSDEVEHGRPYPDLIYLLMQRIGITDAGKVVKVGDTPSDLAQGMAAGCAMVVGVASGTHTAEQLRAHPHTHIVESVRDVPELVLRAEALR